jgi:hypothetical protein
LEVIDDFAKQNGCPKAAIALVAEHLLFKVDEDAAMLSAEMGKVFHADFAKSASFGLRGRDPMSMLQLHFSPLRSDNQTRMTGRNFSA